MQIQEPAESNQKLWHGFYSGPIQQDYTEEQASAQLAEVLQRRPVTRESFAAKQIRLFKTMNESQALKKDELDR